MANPDTMRRENRLNLIANLAENCVRNVNDEKRSLGIVKPIIEDATFPKRRTMILAFKQLYLDPQLRRVRNNILKSRRSGFVAQIVRLKNLMI